MSDEIADIRARWAGVRWQYHENEYAVWLTDALGSEICSWPGIDPAERATLRLAAQAPADIRALLMSEAQAWEQAGADRAALNAALIERETYRAIVATLRDVLAGNLSTSALRVALAGLGRTPGGAP